jgi:hypothetical protein
VLVLSAAAPAAAEDGMRVNEIYPSGPGGAFVELLSVYQGGEPFRDPSYDVVSYDAAGNEIAARTFLPPYPFEWRTTPFVLGDGGDAPPLAVAPGSGRVCFRIGGTSDTLHCLRYEDVPPGQSAQRQPCGRSGTAAPTRGQENTSLAVCEGRRPCDDYRLIERFPPKMRVLGKKTQDVDKFTLRFVLNEDGDVNVRGSAVVNHSRRNRQVASMIWGPIRRDVKANVPVRVRIPLTAAFRRAVKRYARRGFEAKGYAVTIGRDMNCSPNRAHSSRAYDLTP